MPNLKTIGLLIHQRQHGKSTKSADKKKEIRIVIAELKDDSDDEDDHEMKTLKDIKAHNIKANTNDEDDVNNGVVHSHRPLSDNYDEPRYFATTLHGSFMTYALTANFLKSKLAKMFRAFLIDTD